MRRLFDVVLAGAALVVLLPVLVAIAVRLACDGSGSVLYAETRLGRGGRPFRLHKFRTLRAGSPVEPAVAVPADPRVTGPGRWLRRWRLDELPQLWNIVCGTMSLVGPRPQTAANLALLDAATRLRLLAVRPGLSSNASLAHLGEDDVLAEFHDPVWCYRTILVPAKARLDLEDLEHGSLWGYCVVLVKTVAQVFSSRARRRSKDMVRGLLLGCGAVPERSGAGGGGVGNGG